jgi:hypothetical protein
MWILFSFLLCKYLGMEFPGHLLALYLTLRGAAKLFPKVAASSYTTTINMLGFSFSISIMLET